MESFKPINMDIELSIDNFNIEDDLNIEYGMQLKRELDSQNYYQLEKKRNLIKKYVLNYKPHVFLSILL
jgi:hypothetical protein